MSALLWIGVGGFIGSILRFLGVALARRLAPASGYPWGTLGVNVLGCLAIGLLAGWLEAGRAGRLATPEARAFLIVGVLGSFTTFSTFGHETVLLARDGPPVAAVLNVVLHLALAAVLAGAALARGWGWTGGP